MTSTPNHLVVVGECKTLNIWIRKITKLKSSEIFGKIQSTLKMSEVIRIHPDTIWIKYLHPMVSTC